jgi:hypothetical protein
MVLVAGVASIGALLATVGGTPQAKAPEASPAPDRTVVRVEHELVPVTVIEEKVVDETIREESATQRLAVQRPAVPRPRAVARKHTRPDGFASRARHLLAGDGRHRPEPFPRGPAAVR